MTDDQENQPLNDAHPKDISNTEAIRDGRMVRKSRRALFMRVALSETGAVRLAFFKLSYLRDFAGHSEQTKNPFGGSSQDAPDALPA